MNYRKLSSVIYLRLKETEKYAQYDYSLNLIVVFTLDQHSKTI